MALVPKTDNICCTSEVAKLVTDAGLVRIISFTSHYAQDLNNARQIHKLTFFSEVSVDAPLHICEQRELYKKTELEKLKVSLGLILYMKNQRPLNRCQKQTPVI